MMIKKTTPDELPKAVVYFPDLHPHISSFLNLTSSEIDIKLKLGSLCNGKILIGASHILNPLAFSYLKKHPEILKKGIVVPYLNNKFNNFEEYYDYKDVELYKYLRDSFKKLDRHYTREEHRKLYFSNQSTEKIVNLLDENISEVVVYRPDVAASYFNDEIVREMDELIFKYRMHSDQLNAIKTIIGDLGYLGDPIIIGEIASSRFYKLPKHITDDLNCIIHRTYGYGGISEFNTGLYTDFTYYMHYETNLERLMKNYDISGKILENILFKEFNRIELDTLSWDDIFALLKREQTIKKLHKGIENIKKESVKEIKRDTQYDCRFYLNELDEIIAPIIEDKIRKEKKYIRAQKGVDRIKERTVEWSLFISGICAALAKLGYDQNNNIALLGFGGAGLPYILMKMWERFGPNEISLFLSDIKEVKHEI